MPLSPIDTSLALSESLDIVVSMSTSEISLAIRSILILFALNAWAIIKVERQLNAEGGSLAYPQRMPSTWKEARRIDGVLSTSIRRLMSGEDEAEVLATRRLAACRLRCGVRPLFNTQE